VLVKKADVSVTYTCAPNFTSNHVPNFTIYDPNFTPWLNVPKIEQSPVFLVGRLSGGL